MNIADLNGKSICILGFGREGQASAKALEEYAPDAIITIADKNSAIETDYEKQIGDEWLQNLNQFDVIIKSPGIPPQAEFESVQEKITNSTQIFLDTVKAKESVVIGITGTKGKSTTSSLLYEILKAAGKDVHLVGNIGIPALDHLKDAKENTIFVQEMSSFQLMNLTSSPPVAVVTSFFPEHLDYHKTMEEYMNAKKHIAQFQDSNDIVFYDATSEGATAIAHEGKGQKVPYAVEDACIEIDQTNLLGEHNLHNIAAATLVAEQLGVHEQEITKAIKEYKGLSHRLQKLGNFHGIEWINDSISTTPETTIAALNAIHNVDCIILGGKDRGLDYSALGKRISNSNLQHIIVLGESKDRIIESISGSAAVHTAVSLEEAVQIAKENASDICLLSPASASHDMFKDFEERGKLFAQYIAQE